MTQSKGVHTRIVADLENEWSEYFIGYCKKRVKFSPRLKAPRTYKHKQGGVDNLLNKKIN